MWRKYRDRGLVVIGINTGERETNRAGIARAFREKHGLTYPVWLDMEDTTMELYGGEGFPTNAVVDREGNLRYAESGYDEGEVVRIIERLVGGTGS